MVGEREKQRRPLSTMPAGLGLRCDLLSLRELM